MEFRDLREQYLQHKGELDSAIQGVLSGGGFIGGKMVSLLEERLADYVGVRHCITCANGTDALLLALMAWGIGEDDAVFVPDFTFFSTAEVVPWVGAVPVFVDVDRDTLNMAPEALEKAVTAVVREGKLNPKAVIPVDLFGQPADYTAIRKIADHYHMLVLEDGAQGFGGRIGEQKACSFGDISTTSFFPSKPLGCYGDGGAVFTDNDEWAELIRSYKVHGKGKDKYDNVRIGMNSRLDTIQAAVLLEKLKFFEEELMLCDRVAMEYTGRLENVVRTPVIRPGIRSSWAQYTVQFDNRQQREAAADRLKEAGIPSAIYYMRPMHVQGAFQGLRSVATDCSVASGACEVCLSLPMHAYLHNQDIEKISGLLV